MSASSRAFIRLATAAAVVVLCSSKIAVGQTAPAGAAPSVPSALSPPTQRINKQEGVWIEGPGYDITYGASYEACVQRCLDAPTCVQLEYYRPQKKCNMYASTRPILKGGDSFVGLKQPKP